MARFTDPVYLRDQQYKTPSNLAARADLHQRFSTAPGSWNTWVFDQIGIRPGERVLEAGGGPAWLWRANQARLPAGVQVCFTDFSPGMLREARAGLDGVNNFSFANVDVQQLPMLAGKFDLVIANHMLYHVPDLPRAVHEMARVLRPGGRLCAATNGLAHLRELDSMLQAFSPRFLENDMLGTALKFRLENAGEWLNRAFARVEVRRRVDALCVTDAGALVSYARSMARPVGDLGREQAADLERFFQARIDRDGGIHITKDAGVVLAWAN